MKSTCRLRSFLVLSLMLACSTTSCARGASGLNLVGGVITPEYFRFRDIVPDDDLQAPSGGWRAVCIHAQLKHGNSEAKTVCKFEVGVPMRTARHGVIPLEEAQFAAASMANRAAREVLSQAHPGEMFAVLCNDFKHVYHLMLNEKYLGATVQACVTEGTEIVPFGLELDKEPAP